MRVSDIKRKLESYGFTITNQSINEHDNGIEIIFNLPNWSSISFDVDIVSKKCSIDIRLNDGQYNSTTNTIKSIESKLSIEKSFNNVTEAMNYLDSIIGNTLTEMSATGAVAGYNTPNAFAGQGKTGSQRGINATKDWKLAPKTDKWFTKRAMKPTKKMK